MAEFSIIFFPFISILRLNEVKWCESADHRHKEIYENCVRVLATHNDWAQM